MPAFDEAVWEEVAREDHDAKNDQPGLQLRHPQKENWMKKFLLAFLGLVGILLVAFLIFAPAWFEKQTNMVDGKPLPEISAEAQKLHDSLMIVDLHGDTLLWKRKITDSVDLWAYRPQALAGRQCRAAGFFQRDQDAQRARITTATAPTPTISPCSRSPSCSLCGPGFRCSSGSFIMHRSWTRPSKNQRARCCR